MHHRYNYDFLVVLTHIVYTNMLYVYLPYMHASNLFTINFASNCITNINKCFRDQTFYLVHIIVNPTNYTLLFLCTFVLI